MNANDFVKWLEGYLEGIETGSLSAETEALVDKLLETLRKVHPVLSIAPVSLPPSPIGPTFPGLSPSYPPLIGSPDTGYPFPGRPGEIYAVANSAEVKVE